MSEIKRLTNGYRRYWLRFPRRVCPHCHRKTFVMHVEERKYFCYMRDCNWGNPYGFHEQESYRFCKNVLVRK